MAVVPARPPGMTPEAYEELLRLRAETDFPGANPFKLPTSDTAILAKGEVDRRRRQLERQLFNELRVHQKTAAVSRGGKKPLPGKDGAQTTSVVKVAETIDPRAAAPHETRGEWEEDEPTTFLTGVDSVEVEEAPTPAPAAAEGKKGRAKLAIAERAAPALEGKENMRSLVSKKREMFLVQMRLDVKRAEILKLEEKARAKEEALKKNQAMLDEDITRFETFLTTNDKNAINAHKHADDCEKRRKEVVQNIKLMRQQISQTQSETAKLKEQGEEATRYQKFLEKLTPRDWKEQQAQMARDRAEARKERWVAARREEFAEHVRKDVVREELALAQVVDALNKRVRKAPNAKTAKDLREEIEERQKEFEQKRRKLERTIPPDDVLARDYKDDHVEEEMPLYFQQPSQLIDAFVALEEQNLFLIQNVQMAEHELEEVESRFTHNIAELQAKTERLQRNRDRLMKQVKEEEKQIEHIKATFNSKANAEVQDKKRKELKDKVKLVYAECHRDRDHGDPLTLQMLTAIEGTLEELLTVLDELDAFDPELVLRLEKIKEKERREKVRAENQIKLAKKNDERLKASLARSQAPVIRKTGKQIMYRSEKQREKKMELDTSEEKNQLEEHTLFGVYLGKDGIPHTEPPDIPALK
jgi:hypothetical protein